MVDLQIYPNIIFDKNQETIEIIKKCLIEKEKMKKLNQIVKLTQEIFKKMEKNISSLYRNKENVKFVLERNV